MQIDIFELLDICPHPNAEVSLCRVGRYITISWSWRYIGELYRYNCLINPDDVGHAHQMLETARHLMSPAGLKGKTTEQMRLAPLNAYYVWPGGNLHYPVSLAKFLNRDDLRVISDKRFFTENLWRGKAHHVIDHAVNPVNMNGHTLSAYKEWCFITGANKPVTPQGSTSNSGNDGTQSS